ncbi:MAG: methyltransferase [Gammaproteobacteria bacterium]|nr:methyltransferase [Gammaproteobacteria bacterium]
MGKKIKFESFKYRFLIAAQRIGELSCTGGSLKWSEFVKRLNFSYEKGEAIVAWDSSNEGSLSFPLGEPDFYFKGDTDKSVSRQKDRGMMATEDPVKRKNEVYFEEAVMKVAKSAGYESHDETVVEKNDRLQKERDFHDAWAESEDVEKIDVLSANEVCTAPEMRYITKRLGNIKGKRLLDVGCGLGEASVYFALLGADVTSSDLSQGMLDATTRLAVANGVNVKQHLASAEEMKLSADEKFDIIYAGNLLHHVDIEETIKRVRPHLAADGVFVTWDPLAYNPAINVYRKMAEDVRTPDEHPLTWSDIKLFRKHYGKVETKYFWLTTLVIFVIMALAQKRNPNKERFWKVVVEEGNKWKWLYQPLEFIDRILLFVFPPLRLLCWNVVVVCKL